MVGVCELVGGLAVVVGYLVSIASILLGLWCLVTGYSAHRGNASELLKNVTMAGGFSCSGHRGRRVDFAFQRRAGRRVRVSGLTLRARLSDEQDGDPAGQREERQAGLRRAFDGKRRGRRSSPASGNPNAPSFPPARSCSARQQEEAVRPCPACQSADQLVERIVPAESSRTRTMSPSGVQKAAACMPQVARLSG